METTGRDKQNQTLRCHFASQEHPPAKSELLRQPPASCRAQVVICIPGSAARTGAKAQRHDWGFLHSPPQDFKEAELGFVWTFPSWQREISLGKPQSVENSSSVVCSFIQVQAVWEHWILFSVKILQLRLQQLLPGNRHKWEHFEPMKQTVYSSCLVPKYHNHESSIK